MVMSGKSYDIAIIGGGIVGLATARHSLSSFPGFASLPLRKKRARRTRQ